MSAALSGGGLGAGRSLARRCAASAAAVLLGAGLLALAPAASPAAAQAPSADYDADNDGLIEIGSLAQLDAVRWDLDGDGTADVYRDGTHDTDGAAGYAAAFPNAATGMGCPTSGCTGYELAVDLNFDTNGSGTADSGDAYWNDGKGWRPIGGIYPTPSKELAWYLSVGVACVYGEDHPCRDKLFRAVFDGNGHTIANLHIADDRWWAGLFGWVHGGTIRDVGLTAPAFGSVSGFSHVGSLVGLLEGGRVSGSWAEVDVSGTYSDVGGLVGLAWRDSVVEGSYATGDVTAPKKVGGLVGHLSSRLAASYATGNATCEQTKQGTRTASSNTCGGLVGLSSGGELVATYATGHVIVVDGSGVRAHAGGLVAMSTNHVLHRVPAGSANYSTGRVIVPAGSVGRGGLVGLCRSASADRPGASYWDTEASGVPSDGCATGYSTAQLQSPTGYTGIYADWNVDVDGDGTADDPWDFGTSSQYPVLKWGPLDPAKQRPDPPPPVVPELSISAGIDVREGSLATFTITAEPMSPVTVMLAVSEEGDWGASGASSITMVGAERTYRVATSDDLCDEPDGSVTVTLQPGDGYTVSASAGSASARVSDNDPWYRQCDQTGQSDDDPSSQDVPVGQGQQELQDAQPGYVVDAGVVARVEALAGQTHHGEVHVNRWSRVLVAFGVLDGAGVAGGAMTAVQAQAMADAHSSPVWDEVVTELTALEASRNAQQDQQPDSQQDQQVGQTPELSISAGSGVTEGGTASFTITASPVPLSPVTVKVGVSEVGSFGASGTATVTVSGASATYTVTTADDQADEPDGSVTVTLLDGSGYAVSSSGGSATVSVADDDDPPAQDPPVDQGQQDSQQQGSEQEPPGYVVDAGVVARVEALAGQTHHGEVHVNRWSRVLVAFGVLDGAGVTGGAMTAVQAQAMADAHSSPVWDEVVTELTALEASRNAQQDSQQHDQQVEQVPEMSVSAGSGITEGGSASFTITASPVPASPITVKVGVSETGSFGASGAATVTVSGPTTTYTVTTTDDQADEVDGSVTVTLQGGSGYTVSSTAGAATVSVADDDDPPVPVVSISAGGGVTEGGSASFTITASPAPASPITVKVAVSESGSFGASGAATVTVSGATATYTVTTTDDDADEADGSVTATLQDGSGYTVSSASSTATVSVADDDDPPVQDPPSQDPPADQGQTPKDPPVGDGPIAMSVSDASAVEGSALEFTITLSRAADAPVDVVYVTLEGTASSADYAFGNDIVTIAAGQTALTVSIATTADGLAEGAERMYFELAGVFGDADIDIADGDATGTITDN